MSAASATAPRTDVAPRPRRFTVAEYHQMGEAGIFTEDDRVELLAGEIYEMSPIGDRHVGAVNPLTEFFVVRLVGTEFMVSVQNPIRLGDDSEPQPDLVVMRRGVRGVPDAVDVPLVVEVADSSRDYDRGKKLPLYAAAGIPEVWLVDVVAKTVERYTKPRGDRYRQVVVAARGDTVTSTVLPAIALPVADILG